MPPLDYKLSVLLRKLLGARQLLDLESLRFPQLDTFLDVEHCFASASPHVDVNGPMFVAVKEEPIPIFLKDVWHAPSE
jgi:hypothetical protein